MTHVDEPPTQTARVVRLLPASRIKPKRVRWLWDGRVPLGEITLIAGREGAGKSTFLAWMVRAITRGELPGEFHGQPRAVLYAAAEDSWAYTVVPRLIAAGADLNLVYRIEVVDQEHGQAKMTLPMDTADVLTAGAAVGSVALMLDPGLSFLDDRIDTFRTPEVRPALEALRRHAERFEQAVLMLAHFNKTTGTDVLTKIAGSRAFAEVARAALAVAVDDSNDDEDDDGRPPFEQREHRQDDGKEPTVILSQVKNNLGRMNLPNLTYVIRDAIVETEDGDAHVGKLYWTGESDRTAEQALNGFAYAKRKKPLGDTGQAITNYLRSKFRPVSLSEIIRSLPDVQEGTLKKELRRLVDRGLLTQPSRGMYSLPSAPDSSGSFGAATSATSATFPAHTHTHIDGGSGGGATSATNGSGKVAEVAGRNGATTPLPQPRDDYDLWSVPLVEPAEG